MTETCVRMSQCAADSKASLVAALVRRGHSLADARQLADGLSADPVSHLAARERIADELEYRAV
ncbi:hypothetical protein [Streptomyces sp. NPDC001221]